MNITWPITGRQSRRRHLGLLGRRRPRIEQIFGHDVFLRSALQIPRNSLPLSTMYSRTEQILCTVHRWEASLREGRGWAFVSTIVRPGDVPPSRRLIAETKMAELSVHHHSADGSLGSMMVTELSTAHSIGSSSGSRPRSPIASSNR